MFPTHRRKSSGIENQSPSRFWGRLLRQTLLATAVATLLPVGAALAASAPGDVVGKVTVGYQGWFTAAGDGSPTNVWNHQNLEMWPDVREFVTTYAGSNFSQAGVTQPNFFGNLGNGQPAKMFTSYDQQVVNTHFKWMAQYGIDCAALQRFASETTPGSKIKAERDGMAQKVMNAAAANGRKFYMMYDSKATDAIEADWTDTIVGTLHLTSSSAYAYQNGKPVVCLWGIGVGGRGAAADWANTVNWFKSQGCYVIGGTDGAFSWNTANAAAYNACDMIMPWRVGWTGAIADFQNDDTKDLTYCNAHNIDYQSSCYPGTAFYNSTGDTTRKNQIPRNNGNFMWNQFAAMRNANVQSFYIAMFDEVNEATSIFKVAEDSSMIPAGNYFLTLDADGVHCSSDFYLRLTGNGIRMVKGLIPYQATHTTPYVGYEAEKLTVANYVSAAGGTVRNIGPDPSLGDGDGRILDSNNVNDYVTFVLPNVAAGTYDVKVGLKKNNSRGQFQLQVGRADNFSGTVSNVGPVIDEYSAIAAYTEVDLGAWTPGTTSDKWFRFLVKGKNASSAGTSYNYAIAVDYLTLTPQ